MEDCDVETHVFSVTFSTKNTHLLKCIKGYSHLSVQQGMEWVHRYEFSDSVHSKIALQVLKRSVRINHETGYI